MASEKRSRARRKRTRPVDESASYDVDVVNWSVTGSSGSGPKGVSDHFQIDVSVRFETPVNGVAGGDLLIYASPESRGGTIHYDRERRLHGCLWMDAANTQMLATLLALGKAVVLGLEGTPFRYRRMFVDRVFWYTKGDPDPWPLSESIPERRTSGATLTRRCRGRQSRARQSEAGPTRTVAEPSQHEAVVALSAARVRRHAPGIDTDRRGRRVAGGGGGRRGGARGRRHALALRLRRRLASGASCGCSAGQPDGPVTDLPPPGLEEAPER